ncbi:MAG TPA: sigma-54 dependent transcriptional regulator [Kofleriaceae bacterium]|nr:sigma-54 dependent transcriptional regulator [Kofleriaceae bacterium]
MAESKARVLVVDDDAVVARTIQRVLAMRDYQVEHLGSSAEVQDLLERRAANEDWDAIVLDVNIGELNGLHVLAGLRDAGNRTAVVMLTGDDSATTATSALRGGAFHYLVKPLDPPMLLEVVDLAVRHTAVHRDLARPGGREATTELMAGKSPAMAELRRMVPRVAGTTVSVLVVGESGTGKEVLARTLHQASARAKKTFVALNCGAIPEGLIDSELFGHTRGAFTGATSARPGVFVEADGGTLFLDEIGDMPLPVQARLLRALQEREVRPVGSDSTRAVDVRVIAATNVDLARAVEAGRFRADLYFRLNVVSLRIPPLRDRPEDIPGLISTLVQRHAGGQKPMIEEDALEAMMSYPWPGNVRELENAIQHALALTKGAAIDLMSLPTSLSTTRKMPRIGSGSAPMATVDEPEGSATPDVGDISSDVSLSDAKKRAAAEFERAYLLKLLEQNRGSVSAAARVASIDRTNFRRLLQRHNIDPAKFKA